MQSNANRSNSTQNSAIQYKPTQHVVKMRTRIGANFKYVVTIRIRITSLRSKRLDAREVRRIAQTRSLFMWAYEINYAQLDVQTIGMCNNLVRGRPSRPMSSYWINNCWRNLKESRRFHCRVWIFVVTRRPTDRSTDQPIDRLRLL